MIENFERSLADQLFSAANSVTPKPFLRGSVEAAAVRRTDRKRRLIAGGVISGVAAVVMVSTIVVAHPNTQSRPSRSGVAIGPIRISPRSVDPTTMDPGQQSSQTNGVDNSKNSVASPLDSAPTAPPGTSPLSNSTPAPPAQSSAPRQVLEHSDNGGAITYDQSWQYQGSETYAASPTPGQPDWLSFSISGESRQSGTHHILAIQTTLTSRTDQTIEFPEGMKVVVHLTDPAGETQNYTFTGDGRTSLAPRSSATVSGVIELSRPGRYTFSAETLVEYR